MDFRDCGRQCESGQTDDVCEVRERIVGSVKSVVPRHSDTSGWLLSPCAQLLSETTPLHLLFLSLILCILGTKETGTEQEWHEHSSSYREQSGEEGRRGGGRAESAKEEESD